MITLIDRDADLLALRPEWDVLWRQAGAMPFASLDWLLPWWSQFGTGRPRVAVLRDGARLLGLWPLYELIEHGSAKILPMGVGISDEMGPILAPDAPGDAAFRLLAAALRDTDTTCDLPDCAPGSRIAAPVGWQAVQQDGEPRPLLALGAVLGDTVPANTLRKLRMNRNRAVRIGGATIRTATAATVQDDLNTLIRLHTARWQADAQPGVLADPRVVAFHRAAAPGLLAAGVLRLQLLFLHDQPAAAIHALCSPDCIHFYLSGYDAAFAHESPGSLLLGAMLEAAIAEGRTKADFLRGGEAYKYAWGAVARSNVDVHLTNCVNSTPREACSVSVDADVTSPAPSWC